MKWSKKTFLSSVCFGQALLMGMSVWAEERAARVFDIELNTAASSLQAFSKQSGLQLLYNPRKLDRVSLNPVRGEYTPEQALQVMLGGTGLKYKFTDSQTVTVGPNNKEQNVKKGDVHSSNKDRGSIIGLQRYAQAQTSASDGVVLAQASPATTTARSSGGFDEIVIVGARRRETLLQETGGSIQALSGALFDQMGVEGTDDISLYSPGVNIQAGQIGFLSIRGIKSNSFSAGTEGASSLYVDGIYYPRTVSVLQENPDVTRVEVLRGPQGTQFGRNAMGGAINIITGKPTEEFELKANVRVGELDEFRVDGVVSGPLVKDQVLVRFQGVKGVRDGHVKNLAVGSEAPERLDDQDILAFRGHVETRFSENVKLLLSGDWLRTRETGPAQMIIAGATAERANGAFIPDGIRNTAVNDDMFQNVDHWGLSATLDIGLSSIKEGLSLRFLTSYRDLKHEFLIDGDLTDLDSTSVNFDETSKSYQNELQLTYESEKLSGVFGVFYFREENTLDFAVDVPFVRATEPPALLIQQFEDNVTDAFAVFTDWAWNFTNDLRLNVGLRWSWEKKDHVTGRSVTRITPPAPVQLSNTGPLPEDESWSAFTPRIGLDYFVAEGHMLYALVSRGFKAGGFNLGAKDPFGPEFAWNYEVGYKGSLLDNRLQTNLSLFWMDISDQQVQIVERDEFFVTSPRTTNAGASRVRGVEFDAVARPTDWLTLSSSATYLDAKFKKFFAAVNVLGTLTEFDLSGNRPTQTPEWSFSNSVQLDFTPQQIGLGFGGAIMLRLEHQFVDNTFGAGNGIGELNRPRDKLPSYNIFNARISYQFPDERTEISFLARNFTNALRVIRLGNLEQEFNPPSAAPLSWMPGKPRLLAVQFSYKY